MAGRLEGKVAVITGGASGMGAATAELFIAEGARVVIGDMQDEVGAEVAAAWGDRGAFVHCDVSKEDDVAALVHEATHRYGRLDVMFNNAGFGGTIGPIGSISEDEFDLTFDVLLKGVFFGMKHAAPVMTAQGSGSIISTASVAGILVGYGPHLYNVAKAAVIHLTKSVAAELGDASVRVNCICPGIIATPLAAARPISWGGREKSEERMQQMRESGALGQPLPRVGEGDDIARAALFLASDDSEWVTGLEMIVDGGFHIGRSWRDQPRWLREPNPIRLYRPEGR
jgi:NAD(P)-dependent dehydrogenase (short-subunit alcohol dehydrogenase family)